MSLSSDDCDVSPARLHPAFHGCLDWHSSAHMQYSAVLLLNTDRDNGLAALLDARLTPDNTRVEAEYLRTRPGFERPYGWAWAATLAAACHTCEHPHATTWAAALGPVVDVVFSNLAAWLPTLAYPVRSGVHDNTAFSLGLLWDAATTLGREDITQLIEAYAVENFGSDRDYPVQWEPSGSDFLSAALSEATLMQRVLDRDSAVTWLHGFLPDLGSPGDPLLSVPKVIDRTDGKAVHLFGLALSRAWHLRELSTLCDDAAQHRIAETTERQVLAVDEEISHGDFMSTHWLVTFALRAQLAKHVE